MSTTQLRSILGAFALATSIAALSSVTGCAADTASGGSVIGSDELVGADDSGDARAAESVLGNVPVGSTLKATTGVNLRSAASTSASIYHVVPSGALVTVVQSAPSNGFYKVKHNGVTGWSYGLYYNLVSSSSGGSGSGGGGGTSTGGAIADGITRAKEGVGFSYWWGHGRWLSSGPTSSTAGTCSGSCPSCSHGGSYGADCSGYVAKIWQVPSSNSSISTDAHPYSTGNFVSDSSQWSTVGRGSAKQGDAFVYNSGGAGHIFLFESGDGWGSMWAYEAKGCSYGIVHNLRTASSSYHAIRRSGW